MKMGKFLVNKEDNNYINRGELYLGQIVWFGVPDFTKSCNKSVKYVSPGQYIIKSFYFELIPVDETRGPIYRYSYLYGSTIAFYRTREDLIKSWNSSVIRAIESMEEEGDKEISWILSKSDLYESKLRPESPKFPNIVPSSKIGEAGIRKYYTNTSNSFGLPLSSYISSTSSTTYWLERAVQLGTYASDICSTAYYDNDSAYLDYINRGASEEINKINLQKEKYREKLEKYFI